MSNSDLTNQQKTSIQSLSYPLTISAESRVSWGSTYTDNKKVELNEQASTITISSTGGGADNIINISEWSGGLKITGTSNAKEGSSIKLSLIDASSGSTLSGFDNVSGKVDSAGNWNVTLPTSNRPSSSFKIKAELTNELGNISSITSSALSLDFEPSKVKIQKYIWNCYWKYNLHYRF